MNINTLLAQLSELNIAYETDKPLKEFTTWKIGGPADVFVRVKNETELISLLKTAHTLEIPVTYLGGGSNVLISDEGIRGIVVKNEISRIDIGGVLQNINLDASLQEEARLIQVDTENYYDFTSLDYDESANPLVAVDIYSGTFLSYAINYLIQAGVTGLQWFAGIPGTIGGAIFNNIHGGSHFIGEYIKSVTIIDKAGNLQELDADTLNFKYDYSDLQERKDLFILKARFQLYQGDKQKALATAIAWAQAKKKKQPYNSAGCCFKNITEEERAAKSLESNSWGYIIDKVLDLKGYSKNGAQVSDKHAAFIETDGTASSEDVISVLDTIYKTADEKIGLKPKTEIFFLGFPEEKINKYR